MDKRKSIVVVGAILLIAVGVWLHGYLNSPPATAEFTWPSSSGGFVQYTASDEAVTSLLVSMLPVDAVSITGHVRSGWGLTSERLSIKPRSGNEIEIGLSPTPTAIFVDEEGNVTAESWAVSREQFQKLIELLESAPIDNETRIRDSVGVVRQFLQNITGVPVPRNLEDFVNGNQYERSGQGAALEVEAVARLPRWRRLTILEFCRARRGVSGAL